MKAVQRKTPAIQVQMEECVVLVFPSIAQKPLSMVVVDVVRGTHDSQKTLKGVGGEGCRGLDTPNKPQARPLNKGIW